MRCFLLLLAFSVAGCSKPLPNPATKGEAKAEVKINPKSESIPKADATKANQFQPKSDKLPSQATLDAWRWVGTFGRIRFEDDNGTPVPKFEDQPPEKPDDIPAFQAHGNSKFAEAPDPGIPFWIYVGGSRDEDPGESIRDLNRFSNLKGFHVRETNFTPKQMAEIAKAPNLETVVLQYTKVGGAGVAALKAAPKLRTLYLWKSQVYDFDRGITAEYIQGAAKLPQLEDLKIWGSTADASTGMALANHPGLRSLDLIGLRLNDAVVAELAKLPNLTSLKLEAHQDLTDASLKSLASAKKLRNLNLRKTKFSPEAIAELQKAIPDLKIEK